MRFSKALPNFLLGYIALHLAVAAIFLFVLGVAVLKFVASNLISLEKTIVERKLKTAVVSGDQNEIEEDVERDETTPSTNIEERSPAIDESEESEK